MSQIPLLGGPNEGTLIPVAGGRPASHIVRREKAVVVRTPLSFRRWITKKHEGYYSFSEDERKVVRQEYDEYCRSPEHKKEVVRDVYYNLVRWGNPWRLHYVHPDHPAAQFALSY